MLLTLPGQFCATKAPADTDCLTFIYLQAMKSIFPIAFFLMLSLSSFAQAIDRNEVYAVFTFRFTKMIELPSKEDYRIVVYGNQDVAKRMEKFHQAMSNGRKVHIHNTNKIEELKNANIVFVGDGRSSKIQEIVATCPTAFIITERDKLVEKGGHISFVANEDKISYEISKANSEAIGIKLSREILTYAKRVL